jgi:tetratricopeptide (TPR) repeat protein
MAKPKSLQDIKKLFLKHKYAEVVRLLEPEIYRFRDSFLYYRLLGLSCLHLQDGGGAFSYLNRALQIKEDDVDSFLGIAAVHLKKRNIDEALKIWLRVLELSPGNRTARRALNRVRKGMGEDEVSRLVDSGKIRMFYPAQPFRLSPAVPLVVLALAAAAVGGWFLVKEGPALLAALKPAPAVTPPPARPEIAAVELSGDALRTDFKAKARFTFTEAQIDQVWKTAKDYFMAYRDNAAVYELNRLLDSNASLYIKENVRRLKSYARTPEFKDFINFPDNYPLAAVAKDPSLYDGCYVLWRGTVANLFIGKEQIKFQFLVGSYDNRTFEGAVSVVLDFGEKLENNYYLELMAKVAANGSSFTLKGALLRRLIAEPLADK